MSGVGEKSISPLLHDIDLSLASISSLLTLDDGPSSKIHLKKKMPCHLGMEAENVVDVEKAHGSSGSRPECLVGSRSAEGWLSTAVICFVKTRVIGHWDASTMCSDHLKR